MRKITLVLAFLFMAGLHLAQAQTRTITGKVTSAEDGMGIPGVTIQVEGTTIGTVTDIDGFYSISFSNDYKTLVFSFVGLITQKIDITDDSELNVIMEADVFQVDEVVVTAIAVTKERKALGYSVQDVSSDDFARDAQQDVLQSLGGRAAGVEVTSSSGAAGGATYITIRGATSVTRDNQPLFVVDGVPIDNTTTFDADGFETGDVAGVARGNRASDINPDDIESVSVLKGGAATALYGIRGSNGVILITTKSGKATKGKKISVNWNSQYTWSEITQVPDLNSKYAQGFGGQWGSGNTFSWGPRMDTMGYSQDPSVWSAPDFDVDGALVSQNSNLVDPSLGPARAYDQYDFFETGIKAVNTINVSGGSDKANFFLSGSDLSDKGVVPNNTYKKNTIILKGETAVTDKLKISGLANYITSRGQRIQQGSNISGVMLGLLRTPPSFNNAAGYEFPDGTQRTYRSGGGYDNPYWTANKNKWEDRLNRLLGNLTLNYVFTDYLSATWRLGIDTYNEDVKDYVAVNSRAQPSGQVYARQWTLRDINSDLLLNFNKDLTEAFNLNATVGWNMYDHYRNYVATSAVGLNVPGYYDITNSASISSVEQKERIRRAGLFADVGLSWMDMLFLNGTFRSDWSTTLPEENQNFNYGSVNAGWIFTELAGLKDNNILPFGKLRASWAATAFDAPPYVTKTYYFQNSSNSGFGISDGWVQPNGINFPAGDFNAFTYGNLLGNNLLQPERSTTYEFGIELKFVNNRVGIDVTYFNTQSEKLLLPVDVDPATGFNQFYLNAASMESKGWEIVLYATPVKTKNFTWDILANFTSFENPVTGLADGVDAVFLGGFVDPQIRAVVGEQYRTIYGYDWLRDDAGNLIIQDDPNQAYYGYPIGDYTFTVLGRVNPKWTMGITNTFRWKDLTLSALIDIRQGNQMWNGTKGALYYFGTHADTESRDELVTFEGVGQNSGEAVNIPVLLDQTWRTSGEGSGFTGPTVDYIEDANWVRLKTLTLNYSLTRLLGKSQNLIKKLDVFFTGTNLWLSTPYTGIDPETSLLGPSNAQGMDYFNMPGTRSYTLGLRLGL